MYYVYALQSLRDSKHNFGQTNNILTGLKNHNEGKVKSTKFRRPLKLVGTGYLRPEMKPGGLSTI